MDFAQTPMGALGGSIDPSWPFRRIRRPVGICKFRPACQPAAATKVRRRAGAVAAPKSPQVNEPAQKAPTCWRMVRERAPQPAAAFLLIYEKSARGFRGIAFALPADSEQSRPARREKHTSVNGSAAARKRRFSRHRLPALRTKADKTGKTCFNRCVMVPEILSRYWTSILLRFSPF